MGQFDTQISDFLLAVHEASQSLTAAEFQQWTLRELRNHLDFDFAIWGAGDGEARELHTVTVLDQTPHLFKTWEPVKHEDPFAHLVIGNTGHTWALADLPKVHHTRAYNEHWRLYDAKQMMSTMELDDETGLHVFLTLCRDAATHPFNSRERLLKSLVTRHLFLAAQHNNRFQLHSSDTPQATAMVDKRGLVHCAGQEFRHLVAEEWGDRARQRLPLDMGRIETQYQGQSINLQFMPMGNLYIVRALAMRPIDQLTAREQEIAYSYAKGGSYKEVARQTGISPHTVRNHLQAIYRKLGVNDKGELASLFHYPPIAHSSRVRELQ